MEENKKAAQKKKISHAIIMVVLILLFLMFIFPFILVIINAFKTKGDIMSDPMSLVGSHGFIVTNFSDAMKKMNFTTSFTNSLIITISATIGTILLSAMTAFVIVRNNWKACKLLFTLMIASMVIPFQVLMIPLVSLYGGIFGVLNSRVTLILMHIGFSLSMATFMFHGAIHTNIPLELEEAAFLDGCSNWRYLWKVMVPIGRPSLVTVVLLNALASWNSFMWPLLVIKTTKNRTLPFGLYAFTTEAGSQQELIMAASTVVVLPMILLFLFARKQILRGVARGGIKG